MSNIASVTDVLNDDEIYSRQNTSINLKGEKCNIMLVIIGVGGIGSWVALDAALSGQFNNIVMYDNDNVEASNLNRTPFRICDIGRPKVFALQSLILERRVCQQFSVIPFARKFKVVDGIDISLCRYRRHTERTIVLDCRDNVFNDYQEIIPGIPIFKLGYDGLEITIDGNARQTKVMGENRGYTVVPSFICPAQLIANLVVNHIVVDNNFYYISKSKKKRNIMNRVNSQTKLFEGIINIDTSDLLFDLVAIQKIKEYRKKRKDKTSVNIKTDEAISSNDLEQSSTKSSSETSSVAQ